MTTIESNILIAEFDGWIDTGRPHPFIPELGNTYSKEGVMGVKWAERFKYHTSWDWLMPVVENIEKLSFKWPGRKEDISVNVHIFYDSCQMLADDSDEILFHAYGMDGCGKLSSTYKAVVHFIQWYNKQPKS